MFTDHFSSCQTLVNQALEMTRPHRFGAAALLISGLLSAGIAAAATHGDARVESDGGQGAGWSPLGSGIPDGVGNSVQAVITYGNALVAAGDFESAGGILVSNVALWDGTEWSSLGEGVDGGPAVALCVYGGELYAGGLFQSAGGQPASRIAKWDGTNWSALGDGADAAVRAFVVYEGELIVGGEFSTIGGIAAQRIAKWNGTAWSTLGSGLTDAVYSGTVESLAVYNNELIVGGLFDHAGGVAANNVARWNGSNWTALSAGVNGDTFYRHVYTLGIHEDALYAGGSFTVAGGAPANHIARWNGATWSALGDGVDAAVRSVTTYGGQLAAGGVFHTAGGSSAERIARWDGTNWSAFGTGMDDIVASLSVFQGQLIAGGIFMQAGDVAANFIAAWGDGGADLVFTSGFEP